MPTLVAAKELRYGGRTVEPGESFEASGKDAKLLKAIGKATDGKQVNKTDLPKAAVETLPKAEVIEEPAPLSPTYLRRDMRAEDGPTGEAASVPSSRRGRPREARTSEDSEE